MTARKPAAKKSASSTRAPSPAARIAALEKQVGELKAQLDGIAKFIALGVAQQLQNQLLGSPDLMAQFQALAEHQRQTAGG